MSRLSSAFNGESTAADVAADVDLTNKTAVVTGGASGIGLETARALAGAGADVTLAVRDIKAGEDAAAEIRTVGGGEVDVAELDLLDLDSVRNFAEGWGSNLDILVNNAGVMAIPDLTLSATGWEAQFATNHLGHFALAVGLREALARSGEARIVSVSSALHMAGAIDFADINFENRTYDPWIAYGQSKTANVLFSVGVSKRWSELGITSNSLMPGGVATNLARHMTAEQIEAGRKSASSSLKLKTPQQGAATSVYLAAHPDLAGISGRYFEDVNEAEVIDDPSPQNRAGVAWYALDESIADQLWEVSENAIA